MIVSSIFRRALDVFREHQNDNFKGFRALFLNYKDALLERMRFELW